MNRTSTNGQPINSALFPLVGSALAFVAMLGAGIFIMATAMSMMGG